MSTNINAEREDISPEGIGNQSRPKIFDLAISRPELLYEVVVEADESDGAFLVYEPDGAIVTNVDADHLDNYGTVEAYAEAFDQFVTHIGSFVVLNADDAGARALAAAAADRGLTVLMAGFAGDANLQARDLVIDATSSTFTVSHDGVELGFVRLAVPGAHYAQDAVLALGAGLLLGEEFGPLAMGLATYTGAARRMQLLGAAGGVRVYDSYAHHPTEIAADLAAARAIADGDRLVVVYQPHLVSRTRTYGVEMGHALSAADRVVVADIYLAREDPDPAVTPALIVDAVEGPVASAGGPISGLADVLIPDLLPGDMVLTLGAGDITTVGTAILRSALPALPQVTDLFLVRSRTIESLVDALTDCTCARSGASFLSMASTTDATAARVCWRLRASATMTFTSSRPLGALSNVLNAIP